MTELHQEWYVVTDYGTVNLFSTEEDALDHTTRRDVVGVRMVSKTLAMCRDEGKAFKRR